MQRKSTCKPAQIYNCVQKFAFGFWLIYLEFSVHFIGLRIQQLDRNQHLYLLAQKPESLLTSIFGWPKTVSMFFFLKSYKFKQAQTL